MFRTIYKGYFKWRSQLAEQEGLCPDNIDDTVHKILTKEQTKIARLVKSTAIKELPNA